jgi:hypothetical protein
MITIFKNIHQTSAPYYRDIHVIIDRIKNGTSKELIQKIRSLPTKTERNELKKQLPSICFSGKFAARAHDKLIEHSGFICIDFDSFKTQDELLDELDKVKRDRYTFMAFISPSDDGFKVVVKIPKCHDNIEHQQYFNGLKLYYDNKYFDINASGISRVCYESYDPLIHVNYESELFEDKAPTEGELITNKVPLFKITNDDEIIKRVDEFWRRKFKFEQGSRNKNMHLLCRYLNEFGVKKLNALDHVLNYQSADFSEHEIRTTLNSAYKEESSHNTRFYENERIIVVIEQLLKEGKNKDEIKAYLKQVTIYPDNIDEIIESIYSTEQNIIFYQKGKTINILAIKYKDFLKSNGFYKYYPEGGDAYVFVRQVGNVYDPVNPERIKSFVLKYLQDNKIFDVYEFMAKRPMYFSDDFLSILDEVQIKFCKDTKESAYIFFRNKAIEVTPRGIIEHDYIDLGAFVWKSQVIDRDINLNIKNKENDYFQFLRNISGQNYDKMKTIIGYLLHGYKSKSNTKAIILNDELISENPEGGTGKGLFMQGIKQLKRLVTEDGKKFKIDKSFAFQKLDIDTQVLFIDDVAKNFNFESLFSIITEGIEIEKKNKDSIYIPVENSPKIVISTNYPIKGVGHSFDRRKIEIELKQYYSKTRTPEQEFGKALFDEWDEHEYNNFDVSMIECLYSYIKTGIIEPIAENGKLRRFLAESCQEFYDFIREKLQFDTTRYYKATLREQFKQEYPDYTKISEKKFTQWLKLWYSFNSIQYQESQDITGRYIEMKQPEPIYEQPPF